MNWRRFYRDSVLSKAVDNQLNWSTPSTPLSSGYQTPRESKEEQWKAEDNKKRDKLEMREMYKELGGRKPRNKGRLLTGVGGGGHRDRGGWEIYEGE